MHKFIFLLLVFLSLAGCASFAPPSPLVTFGGPQTVRESYSEVGLAVGTGWALFPNIHAGGHGWFGRYKHGIDSNFDLGIDAVGIVRSDKGTFSIKSVGRYLTNDNLRIEGAIGVADDSDGKSLNADIALTCGTIAERKWNYYGSLRFGAAKGFRGDIFGIGNQTPADAIFPIVNLGTQGHIASNQWFIFEGGCGYIIPRGQTAAPLIYLACGLLMDF